MIDDNFDKNDELVNNDTTNSDNQEFELRHDGTTENIEASAYENDINEPAMVDFQQENTETTLSTSEGGVDNQGTNPEQATYVPQPADKVSETQQIWQMHNFNTNNTVQGPIPGPIPGSIPGQVPGQLPNNYNNYNAFYKESYKKNTKKSDAWKYILVSLVSSILGGAILTFMLLVIAPIVQPDLKGIVGDNESIKNTGVGNQSSNNGQVKRVEIIQNGESAVTSVAEKVGPSVVGIKTIYSQRNDLFGSQTEGGEGSGIIITSDGYILTNYHVIEYALNDRTRTVQSGAKIQVYLPNRIDKPYTATVKGYDSKTDLAVLKIDESNLMAIEFGDSDDLKVGEPVVAIGNPGGLEYMGSVTDGVISGLNRTVQLDGGKRIKLVQTNAAINPGNSGGALVNIKGQLIGVNTVKMVATGFEGLGFAIPANDAKKISDELIKNTYISKPYLGISVDQRYTEEIARENNMPLGVYVADVEILGAAEKAGIQAGDVITKFNNKVIKSFSDLEEEKGKYRPGDTVSIEIFRDGKTKKVSVKLGETK